MDKFVVLQKQFTDSFKYFLGQPQEYKPKSFPGYRYHGSYDSLDKARASATIHLHFSRS